MLAAYLVMTLGFLFFLSPLIMFFNSVASLVITVPLSVYGLLTMAAAYTAKDEDKWLPIAFIIALIGILLIAGFVGGSIMKQNGFRPGGIISILSLVILIFLDISLFSTVMKMEIFNYMDDE